MHHFPVNNATRRLLTSLVVCLLIACGQSENSAEVANRAPVANAGAAQTVEPGTTVALDGSASKDPDASSLTYRWTLSSKPTGSTAVLSSQTTAQTTFVADVSGNYVASLVVSDGKLESALSSITITAKKATGLLGVPYTATNGMTVTLLSMTVTTLGDGFSRYVAIYKQENRTTKAITEGTLKLYFNNAAAARQFGFFGAVSPGPEAALTRTYTWDIDSTATPRLIQYHEDQLSADEPITGALQWTFPL